MILRSLLCLAFCGTLLAQTKPPDKPPVQEGQQPFKIGVEVNLVSLAVNAHLAAGGFAKGLKQEEFHVLEDGVEQDIVFFSQEAVPVHVALLIDISGSVINVWGPIRSAARKFAAALAPDDRLGMIAFNTQPRLILDWTADFTKADVAMGKILPKGSTALFDALYVTFDDLYR